MALQNALLHPLSSVFRYLKSWVEYGWAVLILMLKPFPLVGRVLPGDLRDFYHSWTPEMLRVYVHSFGRRAFIDQPCDMTPPPGFEPQAEVGPEFRLSTEDIERFYEQGFLGPFTLCSPERMYEVRDQIMAQIEQPSSIYGFETPRDRHLDCEEVMRLVSQPALTERLAQLLGPNLMIWRSQVFLKPPGAPETAWHQASTYLSEEGFKPTLFPPDRDRLFQVTAWVAFDDVDIENGCLQFVPGTHKKIHTVRMGGRKAKKFLNVNVALERDIDPAEVVNMEMRAGQFVLFSERTIHGAPPNLSDRRRWGMTFRVIQPDVRVYSEGEVNHNVRYLKQKFNLSKWGAVMLRGEDTAGVNRHFQRPTAEQPVSASTVS